MPGTWYTSKAIFTDLVEDERKDKFDDDVSGAVGRTKAIVCLSIEIREGSSYL